MARYWCTFAALPNTRDMAKWCKDFGEDQLVLGSLLPDLRSLYQYTSLFFPPFSHSFHQRHVILFKKDGIYFP